MTTAHEILQAAQKHMQDRASTYDKPAGERSMSATVEAFGAITGVSMSEEQGWLFMSVLKAVRSQQGDYCADSYEDGAAYFALAGEAAHVDRTPVGPWIEWNGITPYGPQTEGIVEIQFRGWHKKGAHSSGFVSNYYWGHDNDGADIIAYRIVK